MDNKKLEEFRRNWRTFRTDNQKRKNFLKETIRWFNTILGTVTDDEAGHVGKKLRQKFTQSHCSEIVDCNGPAVAYYLPYDSGGHKPVNQVVYGANALQSPETLFSIRNHEMIHSLQFKKAAALHAIPHKNNTSPPIILCPRDFMMIRQRIEEDANIKQSWLRHIAAKDWPELSTKYMTDYPASHFAKCLKKGDDLQDRLRHGAKTILHEYNTRSNGKRRTQTLNDYYNERHLSYLESQASQMRRQHAIFVRLEDKDIQIIGDALGPNPFVKNGQIDDDFKRLSLSPEHQKRLNALNHRLGIKNDNDLPTFGQALAAKNMTRKDFLAQCREGPVKPKPHRFPWQKNL